MSIDASLKDEIISSTEIRSVFYNYFFRVFSDIIDKEFLGVTKTYLPSFHNLSNFVEQSDIKKGLSLMEEYISLENNISNENQFLEKLNTEFTTLYLLGLDNIPACASVYLSQDKLLKSEPWEKVVMVYKRRNFIIPEHIKEPEDHISIEMLYMQKLNELLYTVTNNQDLPNIKLVIQEQISFLEDHIKPWINMFSEATYNKGLKIDSKLYPAAAIIMKEFTIFDTGLSKELLDALC